MKRSLSTVALLAGTAVLVLAGRESLDLLRRAPERAADEAAIRAADADMAKAIQAKDLERTVSFYADDASLLPVSEPIATGKEAIRMEWSHIFAIPGFNPTSPSQITKLEVSRASDLAYAQGTYAASFEDAEGKPVTERGKWVVVWKKQIDGAWRIVAEISNTDSPPPTHK